jgi:hypothetical protein
MRASRLPTAATRSRVPDSDAGSKTLAIQSAGRFDVIAARRGSSRDVLACTHPPPPRALGCDAPIGNHEPCQALDVAMVA